MAAKCSRRRAASIGNKAIGRVRPGPAAREDPQPGQPSCIRLGSALYSSSHGAAFDGHPDLRRILMWDEFKDFPMRKDYVEPDDYEWEPTPHADVLEKAKRHYPASAFEMGPNAR